MNYVGIDWAYGRQRARRRRCRIHRRHRHRLYLGGTLRHRQAGPSHLRLVLMGIDGQCDAECAGDRACVPGASGDCGLWRRWPLDADGRARSTIAARNLPVKLVLLNNSGLQFVHIEMEEAGIEPFGIEFPDANFAKLAEAFGLTGIRVEDPGDVREGVERLLSTPGPALLDAVVNPRALSLPQHVTFGMAEGFSLSFAKQALHGNIDDVIETVKENVRLV